MVSTLENVSPFCRIGHNFAEDRLLSVWEEKKLLEIYESGMTPIHFACSMGNIIAVELLLEQNAQKESLGLGDNNAIYFFDCNLDSFDKSGWTPLHWAVYTENFAIVSRLLKKGVLANQLTQDGDTALHLVSQHKSLEVAAILLDHNSTLTKIKNKQGETAFFCAIRAANLPIIIAIANHGCDLNTRNMDGETVLHIAVNGANIDVLNLLLKLGVQLEVLNNENLTALQLAAGNSNSLVFEKLLSAGANFGIKNNMDQTLLHLAAIHNCAENCKRCLNLGIDIEFRDHNNKSALYYAIKYDNIDVARLLLNNGAVIDTVDENGLIPLHYAAIYGSYALVMLLVECGADPLVRAKDGLTAFQYAAVNDNVGAFSAMLDWGVRVYTESNGEDTVMHLAAKYGRSRIIDLLKLRGIQYSKTYPVTPLLLATKHNHDKVLPSLLAFNVDEEDLHNALVEAVNMGGTTVASVLVQHRGGKSLNDMVLMQHLSEHAADPSCIAVMDAILLSCGCPNHIAQQLSKPCLTNYGAFRNIESFADWVRQTVDFVLKCQSGSMEWSDMCRMLEGFPFVAVTDIPTSDKLINCGLSIVRRAILNVKEADVLNVHIVGDAKSGKSLAAQWLIALFEETKQQVRQIKHDGSDTQNLLQNLAIEHNTKDVENGRTRGVEVTTLRFNTFVGQPSSTPLYTKDYVVTIYDYGGQEEFLSNHANFLAVENSVYIIVVPLLHIEDFEDQHRVRSISEMLDRYMFWCRYIFSVIRREQAFPTFQGLNVATKPAKTGGIPMITLLNRFRKFCSDETYQRHIENALPVLLKQLKNEFILSTDIRHRNECDFIVTDKIIHVTDNACNGDIVEVIQLLDSMIEGTSINGINRTTELVKHVVQKFSQTKFQRGFLTELEWRSWLKSHVQAFLQITYAEQKLLLFQQRDSIVELLSLHCQDYLLTIGKLSILKEPVNDYKFIVNPALLATSFLGDLLWWFHKHQKDKTNIENLRLSASSILSKLEEVDRERISSSTIKGNNWSMVRNAEFSNVPLVELLNRIGLGLEIYDEDKKEMQTWLIGLAPEFPKGQMELRFTWWPNHEIRRYFRLPDTRACFIPGFFLRIFINMVNNRGFRLISGYGNAAHFAKKLDRCEVEILICQLSDKDQEAFIVSVATRGEEAMTNAFCELNVLRSFIYSHDWGLNFQEFCLPLWFVPNQKLTSRLREDLIDEKFAIDEIMPFIFGIPQMTEDLSEIDWEIHNICMDVRRQWAKLYFGTSPTWVQSNSIMYESHKLEHTKNDILTRNMLSLNSATWEGSEVYSCELVNLSITDIFESYSLACYDSKIQELASTCATINELIAGVSDLCQSHNEIEIRDTLYRSLKYFGCHSTHDCHSMTLQQFDDFVLMIRNSNQLCEETDNPLLALDTPIVNSIVSTIDLNTNHNQLGCCCIL